jgi:hypothetical protein
MSPKPQPVPSIKPLLVLTAIALCPAFHAQAAAPTDPREPAVRKLIDRYFLTWSKQDIERYGQCFHPKAAVQMLDPAGELVTMPLAPFLQSQREAHRQSSNPLTETAESVEIRFEGQVARVVVFWKLVDGEKTQTGYDHFTLVESSGTWRIANLLFYAAEKVPAGQ